MHIKFAIAVLLASSTIGLCSCLQLYGIRTERSYSPDDHKQLEKELGFSSAGNIGNKYAEQVRAGGIDSIAKDYRQPLQFWFYKNGKLNVAEVNCYAGGFPNLNWHFCQGSTVMQTSRYL